MLGGDERRKSLRICERSVQHGLVNPLATLGGGGLGLFGLTALRLGQHRRDQPIELTLTGSAGALERQSVRWRPCPVPSAARPEKHQAAQSKTDRTTDQTVDETHPRVGGGIG